MHGLLRTQSEREFFDYLRLPYLAPEERRGANYDAWLRRRSLLSRASSSTDFEAKQRSEASGIANSESDGHVGVDGSLADKLSRLAEVPPARARKQSAAPWRTGSTPLAHRNFLLTRPGALEMIVPTDKIVSIRSSFSEAGTLT